MIQLNRISEMLFKRDDSTPNLQAYALLDGARDDRVLQEIVSSGMSYSCLFAGKLPRPLALTAPYLVELEEGAPFVDRLLELSWGQSWGYFVTSEEDLDALRRHFRRFLKVKNRQNGKTLFFRFYDPRVFRVYLPSCTSEELHYVLDPVHRCYMEGPNGQDLRVYSLQHPVVHGEEITLSVEMIPVERE